MSNLSKNVFFSSVADPGCLSRIPDPDFYPSRIPDLGSRIQKQQWKIGVKKNLLSYLFFGAINFTKLKYFIFEMLKKKIWANFQRIIELFTQKTVTKLSKIGFGIRDPGSGIRDPEKTYSGCRIQGSKRHRVPNPDPYPQHSFFLPFFFFFWQ